MTNVIVAFPKTEDAINIRNLLVRKGFPVIGVCTLGAQVIQYAESMEYGIVVCGYKLADMMYSELSSCLPRNVQMLLVASNTIWEDGSQSNIVGLSMPIKVYELLSTLEMMSSTLTRRKKKESLKPKARSKEEQKQIQDAKHLLMERNNMTEEEAYRYIQKCSMESGTNMTETAQMVLSLMEHA